MGTQSQSCVHYEEILGTFSLEDGQCSFHSKLPEYKRPKVSAVRDFPPGCGRSPRLTSFRFLKEATSVGTCENNLRNDKDEVSDCRKNLRHVNNWRPVEGEAAVGTVEHDLSKNTHYVGVATPEELMVPILPKRNFFPPPDCLDLTAARKYHVEAVRDFPPLCGISASNIAKSNVAKPGVKPGGLKPLSWWKGKVAHKSKPDGGMSERKREEPELKLQLERSKNAWRTEVDSDNVRGNSLKNIHPIAGKTSRFGEASSSSSLHDNNTSAIRKKVTEALRRFQDLCNQLEAKKSKEGGNSLRRIDYEAARILKEEGRFVNTGNQILGPVPGVEVGDEFRYRVELNFVGLHRQIQGGIDYATFGGKSLATSVVASGGYADDLKNLNSLTYTGQGGNVMNPDKRPEHQELRRGNLALKNSLKAKNHVRVICGSESSDGRARNYTYVGLYLVHKYWKEMGTHGKLVFKFQLDRIEGQSLVRKK